MTSADRGLSETKRALLAAELAKRRAAAAASAAISPRPVGQPPELSVAQRRLWFLDQIAPGRPTYNATLTLRMIGTLDVEALRRALDLIVERHEALRTVGVNVGGAPQGRLLDTGVRWRFAEVCADDLSAALRADASEPFDLSADVMLRASVYRIEPQNHVLILVLHHIACDGWSRGVLFDEIAEIYNADIQGREPQLRRLAIQYGDYARWQNETAANGRFQRDEAFWQEELEGAELILELPSDFPRTGAAASTGERVLMGGAPGSGDALRTLARSEGATFFMAMLAAGGAFLSALTGQEDVVLGSPVANRPRPELEGLIGFFVNTLILRVRLHDDPTFRELLRRCRQTAIACLAHQEMPLDRLVELVNPVRAQGRNPLFQVNFRMQGPAPNPPQLDGLSVTRMSTPTGASRFELAFGLVDEPGAVSGYLEYSHNLFRRSTVEAWQAAFLDLIAHVTADPDLRMSELAPAVLGDVTRHRDTAAAAAAAAARPGIRSRRKSG
jgi:hypothetical protein